MSFQQPVTSGELWSVNQHLKLNFMIKEVTGDITLTKARAIAHGVAPNDHFDSGLALSLREAFPAMYKDFRHYCHQFSPKPGSAWVWSGVEHRIVNLFTQEAPQTDRAHPGKATLANVGHALKELAHMIEKEGMESVAIPRLATGVGGLDWEEVKPLIFKHLDPLPVKVYLYSHFSKGVQAAEN
ncbi:MAG TPA: macro domain-containing protein [Saprospiraceae bacterium]|nr:macro domain-containing protein [Saprospiraceae bacterium]